MQTQLGLDLNHRSHGEKASDSAAQPCGWGRGVVSSAACIQRPIALLLFVLAVGVDV